MQTLVDLFRQFWREATSFADEVGTWLLSVFDPSTGPWPKVIVGLAVLLVVLVVVSRTSRAR